MAERNPAEAAEPVGATLARYYDLDLADDPGDVDLYLAMAATVQGPILELAAGSGRVAVPLAATGREVVAVDRDMHMLERARARWAALNAPGRGSLEVVEDDITRYRSGDRFGLVLIALNSLLLLDRESGQAAALSTVAASLAPGGRAVLDVWMPGPDDLVLYDGRLVLDWVRHDAERDEWVAKSTSPHYSPVNRSAELTTLFDAWRDGGAPRRVMRRDTINFITTTELTAMALAAGLEVETIGSDYDLGPLDDSSDRVVVVCRRRTD